MSRSYWLPIVALAGFLVLAAIGLIGLTHHDEACKSPGPKERPSYTEGAPSENTSGIDVFERMARSLEGIERATDTPDKTEREIADLDAQRDMACWAFWMVFVSCFQAIVALGGTFALVVTIRQGQKALGIGQDSVAATRESTAVTVAKDRAFVFVEDIVFEQVTNKERTKVLSFTANVIFKNGGPTPTKNFRCFVNTNLWVFPYPKEFTHQDFGNGRARAVIGPGETLQSGTLKLEYGWVMSAHQRGNDPDRPKESLLVWGWCEYDDVFPGTPRHRTEFCREVIINNYPGDVRDDLGARHYPVTNYNNTDDECLKPLQTNPPHDGS